MASKSNKGEILAKFFDDGEYTALFADGAVSAACGYAAGQQAYAVYQNGEAVSVKDVEKNIKVLEMAAQTGCPVVTFYNSVGAKLAEGLDVLTASAKLNATIAKVSGVIPQIAVVTGVCGGTSALSAANADVCVMAEDAELFFTAPFTSAAKGDKVPGAGTAEAAAKAGVAAIVAANAEEAAEKAAEQQEIVEEAAAEEASRKASISRKQARAARIAADQAEEEEDIKLVDPEVAMHAARRRSGILSFRSLLVLILAAAAAYLSFAPSFEALPLPVVLDILQNPTIGIGALAALQILALLIGIDVFGNGFSSLLHGHPARGTLVSFAALASLLHCASLLVFPDQGGVAVPYTAVSILLLYAEMREARGRSLAQARSYRAVCEAEQPLAVYSHYDSEIDACNAVKCPLYDAGSFLTEIERPDTVDRFSLIYTPIALALAIVLSLVASFNCGEPVRFFWAFSAILSVSAPVGLLCAFGASYKNTASRLLRSGAAIAGARQANLLRGTEKVMLLENDLFPTGSIELEAIDNLGRITDEQILGCAAALTESAGLELGRVLTDTTKERFGITFTARDVRLVEGGVTGAVGISRIVLGTAALMVKMGIPIESGHKGQINMYLVVDNALAGVLTMRYQTTKNTYKAMRLMRRMHMNAVLAVRDFNISPAMIEEEFDLRRGFADQPDPAGVDRLLNPNYAKGDAPAAILTREGAGPFMQVLRGADKLAGAVRSALTLGTFAGLLGMLIVFYLLYQNAADALPVMNILLYQLIWYIPVFIITQQTR